MNKTITERGFGLVTFKDRYGQECSLQDSSLATESAIWFGVVNTGPNLEGPTGVKNFKIDARMHLTQEQVKQLLPVLTYFAETGDYIRDFRKVERGGE